MAELHWFPFYAKDFLTSEAVLCMTPEQIGGYVTLLAVSWGDGSARPSLPADDRSLAALSRLGGRWKKLGAAIRAQFEVGEDGRLTNRRLVEVWAEQQDRHDKAVVRASAGGKAKAERQRASSSAQSTASSTEQAVPQVCYTDTELEVETETTTHGTSGDVPSVSSEPYARTDYPADFEAFWQAYPADARGTKKTAFKAYRARQRDGHTAEIIRAGLTRYMAFLAATGRYAKQASTFVGPDLHFLEPWAIPSGAGPPENAAQKAERETNERKHRAMLVSTRKNLSDGDSWWDRMMRESASVNQNVWEYAFHHREEVA